MPEERGVAITGLGLVLPQGVGLAAAEDVFAGRSAVRYLPEFADVPGGVMAHSTHVKGLGTYSGGVERPRIKVTLATGIPKERCDRINLGYLDPREVRAAEWIGRQDEGILLVDHAGETLYRLKSEKE